MPSVPGRPIDFRLPGNHDPGTNEIAKFNETAGRKARGWIRLVVMASGVGLHERMRSGPATRKTIRSGPARQFVPIPLPCRFPLAGRRTSPSLARTATRRKIGGRGLNGLPQSKKASSARLIRWRGIAKDGSPAKILVPFLTPVRLMSIVLGLAYGHHRQTNRIRARSKIPHSETCGSAR